MRLHKWLSQLGVTSRRQAEEWITAGRVTVNGTPAVIGMEIAPGDDVICVDGLRVGQTPPAKLYWMLHKPAKVLTTRLDEQGRTTIYDLPKLKSALRLGMNPVGRLDYLSEGLLLLTNDGALCYRLTHPKHRVAKHYQVLVESKLTKEQVKELRHGVNLEDGLAKAEVQFAHAVSTSSTKRYWYHVTVWEGRNRLVRRLFAHYDSAVKRLIRIGVGDLVLPSDLAPGDYQQLTGEQITHLKALGEL